LPPTSAAPPFPSKGPCLSRRAVGYTLLELAVVVVIVSVVALLIPLSLETVLERERLSAAASAIGSLCRFARTEAMASRRPVQLVYDLDAGRFWVEYGRADGRVTPSGLGERLLARSLPRGVRIMAVVTGGPGREARSGRVRLTFLPPGRAPGHLLQLEGPGNARCTVEVTPLLGVVRSHEGWLGYEQVRETY